MLPLLTFVNEGVLITCRLQNVYFILFSDVVFLNKTLYRVLMMEMINNISAKRSFFWCFNSFNSTSSEFFSGSSLKELDLKSMFLRCSTPGFLLLLGLLFVVGMMAYIPFHGPVLQVRWHPVETVRQTVKWKNLNHWPSLPLLESLI